MILSIFTDELGMDVREALPVLASWGLRAVDFRSRVFGKEIHALTKEELADLRTLLGKHGMTTGCLQSSLAKVHLPGPERLRAEQEKLEGLIRAADALDCRLIRTFHYWQPREAELQGALAVRPDELARVTESFAPLARRAREAGLRLAFENCGVTPEEVLTVLDYLGVPEWGLAWDVCNGWESAERKRDEAAFVTRMAERSIAIHVKATRAVPELSDLPLIPWGKILGLLHAQGFAGPVSAETHNPDRAVSNRDMSERLVKTLQGVWPSAAPGAAVYVMGDKPEVRRDWADEPVGFAVVGLGMGHSRARQVHDTPGCRLVGVCDVVEARAARSGEAYGVPFSTDVEDWLGNDEVEVVYVMTETGRHAEIALRALEAGKHVLTTKPMEANVEACDRMIRAAEERGLLLGVDFGRRYEDDLLTLKTAVEARAFGRLLGGTCMLKILRTMDYFHSNGGWRGTKRWDGGGVLSNQSIHHIDELVFALGVPARVRCDVCTQDHEIEAEDVGAALWEYANGLLVTFFGTTSFPQNTWYHQLELHGTEGGYRTAEGGPLKKREALWLRDGKWTESGPLHTDPEWLNAADNFAAAVRRGVPLTCTGRDGRRSRAVLDAMYRSAYETDGGWVDVTEDVAP